MVAFYNVIVSMLEDKEDEDVQEILKYWHRYDLKLFY